MGVIAPAAVLFGLLAAAVTTLGLVLAAVSLRSARMQTGVWAAFAAGALICIIILHLLPEALATSPHAPAFMLSGFAGAYLLNRGVLALADTDRARQLAMGITPTLAIAVHSFLDGAAYSVTFSMDWATGALTALGLILHEAPEGIIVFSLLLGAGFSTGHAFGLAFLAAALTTPLGAIAAQPLVSQLDETTLGSVFAATAGLLLYIGAGHLLPHVEKEPSRRALPALAVGAAIAIGAMSLHGLTHDHGDHDHEDHNHWGYRHHDHGDHDHDH